MKSKKKFNFAIIGCGSVARDHTEVIKKLGHKIIIGSTKKESSKNWKIFKRLNPKIKYVKNIDEILESKKIDFIISCLPINYHKKYCKKILSSKKPVLIEKQLHDNFFQLKNILLKLGPTLKNKIIGYNRRFYKTVNLLKGRINKGGVKSVEITISEDYKKIISKYGVKIIKKSLHVGSSSHILDLAFYFFGLLNILKIWKHKKKNFFSYSILLTTKKNIPIFVNINPFDPSPVGFKVRFDDETLWLLSPIEKLRIYKGYKIIQSEKNRHNRKYFSKIVYAYNEKKNFRPGFYEQMKNFVFNDNKNACTPKENLNLIKIFNSITK